MPYRPTLATLAYLVSPDKKSTLLIHRTRRNDHHLGKYNGLGGKVEDNEDVVTGIIREVKEEAGVDVEKLSLRGTISWPGFGKNGESWFAFIFRIDEFKGSPIENSDEGDLVWMPIDKIPDLPMWEGDKYFLPLVFSDEPRQFHGVMPYKDGAPTGWSYTYV